MKTRIKEKDLYKYLYRAVITKNVDVLLGLCYSIWRMPISIIDVEYNLIGMYPTHPIGDPTYDNIAKAKTISDDSRNDFIKNYYLMNVHKSNAPTIIDWGVAEKNHRYAYRLSSDNVLYGVISMVLLDGYVMSDEDKDVFMVISEAATEILSQMQQASRIANGPIDFLLYSLLTGANIKSDTIKTYLAETKDELGNCTYLLLRANGDSLSSSFYSENAIKKLRIALQDAYINLIGDKLYIVIKSNNKQSLENTILRKTINTLKAYSLQSIYISDAFSDITHLRIYRDQVDFISSFVPKTKSSITYYKDYSIMHIASFFPEEMRNMLLSTSPLRKIDDYDKKHASNLLKTLSCYLDNASDNKKTAEMLNIHRNTLLNRINKIESLSGLSAWNNHDLFSIRLYFILKEYMEML